MTLDVISPAMKNALSFTCIGAFLLLPVIVLWVRATRPKRMPWWAVFAVVVVLGWPLALAIAALNETPDQGASKVFALFFGWAFALAWFLQWLLVYGVIQLVRRLVAAKRKAHQVAPPNTSLAAKPDNSNAPVGLQQ